MTEIKFECLRDPGVDIHGHTVRRCDFMAMEIERLKAALEEIIVVHPELPYRIQDRDQDIAREALEEK